MLLCVVFMLLWLVLFVLLWSVLVPRSMLVPNNVWAHFVPRPQMAKASWSGPGHAYMPLARGVLVVPQAPLLAPALLLPAVLAVLSVSLVPAALGPCEGWCFATETVDGSSRVCPARLPEVE